MVKELDLQNDVSSIAYGWAKRSFSHREGLPGRAIPSSVPQFSSWLDMQGAKIAMTSDGVGTKIEVAERLGVYGTLGADLVAMVVDDLAANGVEPVALSNTLDVDTLDAQVVDALMHGLYDAAKLAKVSVVGGEIAELGNRIGGYGRGMHFNWCATAVGLLRDAWEPIDGTRIVAGDAVVAIESTSMRSNGYSAARRILQQALGDLWHTARFNDVSWGERLLAPCQIYAPAVVALRTNGLHPHGLAHITGGGIPNKFGRILKATGLGAELHTLHPPSDTFLELVRLGAMQAGDAYQHWNMSNGFLIVLPEADVEQCCAELSLHGFAGKHAGRIVTAPGIVVAGTRFEPS
jgi:phosphoribosylformylglycinamidine cyclo-ligase